MTIAPPSSLSHLSPTAVDLGSDGRDVPLAAASRRPDGVDDHDHDHDHRHAGHAHAEPVGPAFDVGHDHGRHGSARPTSAPSRPAPSLMRLSLVARLALAAMLSAAIWGAVIWAQTPIAG